MFLSTVSYRQIQIYYLFAFEKQFFTQPMGYKLSHLHPQSYLI